LVEKTRNCSREPFNKRAGRDLRRFGGSSQRQKGEKSPSQKKGKGALSVDLGKKRSCPAKNLRDRRREENQKGVGKSKRRRARGQFRRGGGRGNRTNRGPGRKNAANSVHVSCEKES